MKTKEQEVLLDILDELDGQGYGVTILHAAEAKFGRFVSLGEIYATLVRLEDAGVVRSTLVEGGKERGYRPKKVWWRA
jgi:Fe2+ or Zn2+ uptake regulation protein